VRVPGREKKESDIDEGGERGGVARSFSHWRDRELIRNGEGEGEKEKTELASRDQTRARRIEKRRRALSTSIAIDRPADRPFGIVTVLRFERGRPRGGRQSAAEMPERVHLTSDSEPVFAKAG